MDTRSRSFCLTINNYDDTALSTCKKLSYAYIIVGDEVGESGTPHLQIYVRLKNALTFKSLKKKFPTAHIEIAQGNDLQNREYCSKQKVLFEDGEVSVQGKRRDIDRVRDIVNEGGNMREVVASANSLQSIKLAEVLFKYNEPARDWKPEVKWYWGATGCGKSRDAHKEMPFAYVAMETSQWWEGYDAHEDVIIDDMRKNFCTYSRLLQLLDRYPTRIEQKGSSRQFLAKRIIITTCFHPREMYETREDIQQLLRRIDIIREFSEKNFIAKPNIILKMTEKIKTRSKTQKNNIIL